MPFEEIKKNKENVKEILNRYSKYCPRCKSRINGVYVECPECKSPLSDAHKHFKFQRIINLFIWFVIILVLFMGTYGVQKNERVYYRAGMEDIQNLRLHAAGAEFTKALSINPTYLWLMNESNEIIKNGGSAVSGIKSQLQQ